LQVLLSLLFPLGLYQIWLLQIRLDLGELVFRSQKNTPNETNDVSNAVICYKESVQTVQLSASFVTSGVTTVPADPAMRWAAYVGREIMAFFTENFTEQLSCERAQVRYDE